jgi:hypothetical protein
MGIISIYVVLPNGLNYVGKKQIFEEQKILLFYHKCFSLSVKNLTIAIVTCILAMLLKQDVFGLGQHFETGDSG